jgi:hypothetical protein
MPTIEDYNAAKAELERLNERWDNYSGNNPDKYRSSIRSASARVRAVEAELKSLGLLPRPPKEELEAKLDAAFPRARSKQIVEFQGKQYIRRFAPLSMSLSGKSVAEWSKSWEEVPQ